ncbi:unnamed protein product [Tuber aestivum]|uniref:Uncharacterized protein n=1 Tax=Tuber aestivum TaxID=59557 RepID=A0A292PM04_9PEZI|nr:unnamed protein product [Tuber aestivum]
MARDKAGSPWSDAEKIHLLLEIAKQNTSPNWRIIEFPTGVSSFIPVFIMSSFVLVRFACPGLAGPGLAEEGGGGGGGGEWGGGGGMDAGNKKRAREELGYDQTSIPSVGQSSTAAMMPAPITKRKRGRPTKAETEARKAAEARGEILPKPKPYVPKTTSNVIVGPDGQVKRRRGRPTKAETEARKARERELKKKQGGGDEEEEDDEKTRQQLGQSEQSEVADDDDDDDAEDDE